jgi:hypothetical protein
MATITAAKRTRKPPKPQTFTIVFEIAEDRYHVFPLAIHPEVGRAAFRFKKLTGGQEVYDVRLDLEGHAECGCPGHVYHKTRKPCKHLRALTAVGMLPKPAAVAPQDNAVPEWPGRDMA